jgi:hypothetical protein
MATPSTRCIDAAARLRAALNATASSLEQPNLDGLLAAEAELTRACADLPFLRQTIVGAKEDSPLEAVREDLRAAQLSLSRSNRLGASLLEFVRLSFDARTRATGDDVAGATAALNGRAFQVRA